MKIPRPDGLGWTEEDQDTIIFVSYAGVSEMTYGKARRQYGHKWATAWKWRYDHPGNRIALRYKLMEMRNNSSEAAVKRAVQKYLEALPNG